jgi:hypothetical protein
LNSTNKKISKLVSVDFAVKDQLQTLSPGVDQERIHAREFGSGIQASGVDLDAKAVADARPMQEQFALIDLRLGCKLGTAEF